MNLFGVMMNLFGKMNLKDKDAQEKAKEKESSVTESQRRDKDEDQHLTSLEKDDVVSFEQPTNNKCKHITQRSFNPTRSKNRES